MTYDEIMAQANNSGMSQSEWQKRDMLIRNILEKQPHMAELAASIARGPYQEQMGANVTPQEAWSRNPGNTPQQAYPQGPTGQGGPIMGTIESWRNGNTPSNQGNYAPNTTGPIVPTQGWSGNPPTQRGGARGGLIGAPATGGGGQQQQQTFIPTQGAVGGGQPVVNVNIGGSGHVPSANQNGFYGQDGWYTPSQQFQTGPREQGISNYVYGQSYGQSQPAPYEAQGPTYPQGWDNGWYTAPSQVQLSPQQQGIASSVYNSGPPNLQDPRYQFPPRQQPTGANVPGYLDFWQSPEQQAFLNQVAGAPPPTGPAQGPSAYSPALSQSWSQGDPNLAGNAMWQGYRASGAGTFDQPPQPQTTAKPVTIVNADGSLQTYDPATKQWKVIPPVLRNLSR